FEPAGTGSHAPPNADPHREHPPTIQSLAAHRRILHGRVKPERVFNFGGINVLTPADDQIRPTSENGKPTLVVQRSEIPGFQPAFAENLRRGALVTEIASHQGRTVDLNFPAFTTRQTIARRCA